MSRNWTDEQHSAIYAPVGKYNILVSADAGSGKTSVLVERICNMIINYGISIENLLVVTFTNAAAAAMKEKIIARLQEFMYNCEDSVQKSRLKEQTYLCATADILTIDAFCLNILKNNFHLAGIAPNFYIIDKTEEEILKEKALEDVFDKLYTSEDEEERYKLNKLITSFADNRSDDKLLRLITDVYRFSQNFDIPIEWVRHVCSYYDINNGSKIWFNELYLPFVYKKNILRILNELEQKTDFTLTDGGEFNIDISDSNTAARSVERYNELMVFVIDVVAKAKKLLQCKDISELFQKNSEIQFGEQPKKYSGMSKFPQINSEYEYLSGAISEILTQINEFAYKSKEELTEAIHLEELSDTAKALAWIIEKYDIALENLKERQNAWSFSDIEHKVFELFNDNENGLCNKYREKYTEILIDEYQDTNGLQDAIFRSISKENKNIFMVGDLKQSIYLFRGGDPYIFKKKFNEYTECVNDDNENDISGRLIKLSKNFRSSREVLKSVDALFSRVMTDEVGDVKYVCNTYDGEDKNENLVTELNTIACVKGNYSDEEKILSRAEAQYMAKKAKELVGTTITLSDGKTKTIGYGDITILIRAIRSHAEVYTDEFKKAGVPLRVTLSDFFDRREVHVMVSLLSVISNFKQDITLVSVLLSPIFAFSGNELAQIKCIYRENRPNNEKASVFDMLAFIGGNCADYDISIKCKNAVEKLRKWRKYTRIMTVAKLIWTIYEESGFYDFMGALEGSEESQKNLRLLYQRAQSYEQSGSRGLFNFVNYMENLRESGEGISSAKSVSTDTVSMMTIHASKGLEFPVVFLGGLGQKLQNPLADGGLKIHGDYGIGITYADIDAQTYEKNIYTDTISYVRNREEMSEYVRLLYVAMTRAQYMLINFAPFKASSEEKALEIIDKWRYKKLTDTNNIHAKCFEDWIMPVAMNSDEFYCTDIQEFSDYEEETEENKEEQIQLSDEGKESVKELLDYKYKYISSTDIPSRTSATELKKAENVRRKSQITIRKKPRFIINEADGAIRGIAYHNAMAFIDLDVLRTDLSKKTVDNELKKLCDEGKINCEVYEKDTNMAENIFNFFNSKLGGEMLGAGNVYRERDFQMNIDASYYKPGRDIQKGEEMILQGVIDCFFEDKEGNIILLDFKTDNMKNKTKEDMLDLYGLQLDLYSRAIEKITKKRVLYKYLYLFDINEEVQYLKTNVKGNDDNGLL